MALLVVKTNAGIALRVTESHKPPPTGQGGDTNNNNNNNNNVSGQNATQNFVRAVLQVSYYMLHDN
jgi:hypothetical protein